MMKFATLLAFSGLAIATPAAAQQAMSEVIGQPISVTTNGVSNTLYFEADGTVRMITPNATSIPGSWAMQGSNLCITKGSATECWPYRPFQPQQPQSLVSSCNSPSTWTAQSTNGSQGQSKGERGR